MSRPKTLSFVLRGKLDGIVISPKTIGLTEFNEFNAQVEQFIAGSQHLKLDQVHLKIEAGSYRIAIELPPAIYSTLEPDL